MTDNKSLVFTRFV